MKSIKLQAGENFDMQLWIENRSYSHILLVCVALYSAMFLHVVQIGIELQTEGDSIQHTHRLHMTYTYK